MADDRLAGRGRGRGAAEDVAVAGGIAEAEGEGVIDYHRHPEWVALLASVLANPADDLPRLVAADWLEEHGQSERAEFIRVQCRLAALEQPHPPAGGGELAALVRRAGDLRRSTDPEMGYWYESAWWTPDMFTFRRGFVAGVHCWLSDWCGGRCVRCTEGEVRRELPGNSGYDFINCPNCHSTLTAPDRGRAASAAFPLEWVRLEGVRPMGPEDEDEDDPVAVRLPRQWLWWRASERSEDDYGDFNPESNLPDDLWGFLAGHTGRFPDANGFKVYPTREAADAALSDALIAWARTPEGGAAAVGLKE